MTIEHNHRVSLVRVTTQMRAKRLNAFWHQFFIIFQTFDQHGILFLVVCDTHHMAENHKQDLRVGYVASQLFRKRLVCLSLDASIHLSISTNQRTPNDQLFLSGHRREVYRTWTGTQLSLWYAE